jgi:hypothetical protein
LFDIVRFEGKEPTADFMVFLVDSSGQRTGPFFFMQVKATNKGCNKNGCYAYSFGTKHVRRALSLKVPFVVCIVDLSIRGSGRIFIKGIDSRRHQGIYCMPCTYDLSAPWVKLALYDEVARIWAGRDYSYFDKLV